MAPYLKLLGIPSLRYQEIEQQLPITKRSALLLYLAYKGEWVDRGSLVYLFWPDATEQTARRRLSRLLIELKKLPIAQHVEINPDYLRWKVATDYADFTTTVTEGRLSQAVQFYSGTLLEAFNLQAAPGFEAWLEQERHVLQGLWRKTVLELVDKFEARGQYSQAADALERLYQSESFDETIIRRFLANLQRSHRDFEAIIIFETFRVQLEAEFDGYPEAETLELVQAIRQRQRKSPSTITANKIFDPATVTRNIKHYDLPVAPTPFVGRQDDIDKLGHHLTDSKCRLLTILAPGGMGKTRLAIQGAQTYRDRFEDGVCFVSLVSVKVPEQIVYAIAAALDITFFGQREPTSQLLGYLSERKMLLILDNLEHLLSNTQLICELLEASASLKILATSRERLDLRAEYVVDLPGLAVPDGRSEGAQHFDALRLFSQCAEHHLTGFTLDGKTIPFVTRICALVGGMPLAIELAASWLRVLGLEDITHELERGINLLEASTRDLPIRHHSIRAVFDHSWHLLADAEQTGFRRLSVFQDGFRREAALEVAGVDLPMLASLTNKSFINLAPGGRYRSHPLIIQYAQEQLLTLPKDKAQAEEKHGLYFLHFAQAQDENLMTPGRKEAFKLIEEDFANIKAAWGWAAKAVQVEELRKTVFLFAYHGLGQIHEHLDMYSVAIDRLDSSNPAHHAALGTLLIEHGYYKSATGFQEHGKKSVEAGLDLLYGINDMNGILNGLVLLSQIAWESGDYLKSKQLADEGLALAQQHDDRRLVGWFLVQLATVIKDLESLSEREQLDFYQQGLKEVQDLGFLGITINFTHHYAFFLLHHGQLEKAGALERDNLRLIRELDYWGLESRVIECLALVAYKQEDYQKALTLLREAEAVSADTLTETFLEAQLRSSLGKVSRALGNYTEAEAYLRSSFEIGLLSKSPCSLTTTLVTFAELRMEQGQAVQAAEWLCLSLHHPGTEQHSKLEARRLLKVLATELSQSELRKATAQGKQSKLIDVVQRLLADLWLTKSLTTPLGPPASSDITVLGKSVTG